jgi:condensin complex subunit 2
MSLLKEGDGVNFQRASCTLDGCVKIYTNRVDSVATETNTLLSGLTESKHGARGDGEADDDGEADEDDDGEDSGKKKSKKRVCTRYAFTF